VHSDLYADAEAYLEQYVQHAFLEQSIYHPLAEHLRKHTQKINHLLSTLAAKSVSRPRTSLTEKFAALANKATANIAGRGGPVPPTTIDLPPITTQPASPIHISTPPQEATNDIDKIITQVYERIMANPGKGL
jgi:hypothetical protein